MLEIIFTIFIFTNSFTREDIKMYTELCDTDYACVIVES